MPGGGAGEKPVPPLTLGVPLLRVRHRRRILEPARRICQDWQLAAETAAGRALGCQGSNRAAALARGPVWISEQSMTPATRDWLEGLREFAAAHRLEKPLAVPESPAERAAERMILAARLADWLAGCEAILAARRAWLAERGDAADADRDPAIVITTSPVGIAVVEEQLAVGSLPARAVAERTVAVTELEYRLWSIRHPDDARDRHLNMWNWIKTQVPPQRHGEFVRHPLAAGEAYWLHRAGIAGAGAADRRDCHLWKFNGRHASLLEAFVAEQGVRGTG